MKVIMFAGSADEFEAVAHLFDNGEMNEETGSVQETLEDQDDLVVDPKEAIRMVIRRRPLSKNLKAVFNVLADGEVKSDVLIERIGLTPEQYAGVMGAFGRRVNNTKKIHNTELPKNVGAFINYRYTDEGYFLSLTSVAKEVLEEEGVI